MGELGSSLMLWRGVGSEFQLSSSEDLGVPPVEWLGKRMLATELRGIFNALDVEMGAIPAGADPTVKGEVRTGALAAGSRMSIGWVVDM